MERTIVAVRECEDVAADNAELRLAHNSRARCVLEMDEEAVEVAAVLLGNPHEENPEAVAE